MKTALFLILTMLSCLASAAWTEVTKSVDGDIHYIDFDTLKKDGQKRTFWRFTNYKVPNDKYYSSRTRETIDCAQETRIPLSQTMFVQNDLVGESLSLELNGKVHHIPPNSIVAEIMQLVCSK
jgi:hypothetical protein